MVIAIDGPAGSGKGTVAKLVSKELNFLYVDTGAMFRCVALEFLRENVNLDDEDEIEDVLNNINIELKQSPDGINVYLNNEDVTTKIRTDEVSNFTALVSPILSVRDKLLKLQRNMAIYNDIVMEGRDIGTVVFPKADVKVYLDASPHERAKRRVKQNESNGIKSNFDDVLKDINVRDQRDFNRKVAPLKKTDDAYYIDSTNLSIDEVVNKILNLVKEKNE